MRILTCTPVAFGGGADFFARDSGLLCRGLQSIGIDSRAVMPHPAGSDDEPDLIRTEYKNLEDPAWWKAHRADGVVLYAWGRPVFRNVAGAIRKAGLFLVLNQDHGGLVSPLAGFSAWLREQWIMGGGGRDAASFLRGAKLAIRGLSIGIAVTDPLRAEHLSHGHVIGCVSPKAAEHFRKLCRVYGRGLEPRVKVVPHAVEPIFHWSGVAKERRIVCVGRWSDKVQKRAHRMMRVIGAVLTNQPEASAVIAGELTEVLRVWHAGLDEAVRSRVQLAGRTDRPALMDLMNRSAVFYSPSAFESFGIAAAEALCCGCSVVATHSVSMSSFEWFVSASSGRLSLVDDETSHSEALEAELIEWDQGGRDAGSISSIWSARLHANRVAERIAGLVRDQSAPLNDAEVSE